MINPNSYKDFMASLEMPLPPVSWKIEFQALWWDAKGNWEKAHELVDSLSTPTTTWIHGYLHRKEGDQWNAEYWYSRAGKPFPKESLEAEFEEIVVALLLL